MTFLCMKNQNQCAEKEIVGTLLFTIVSEKIRYLGINLAKEVKDFCEETFKSLNKEIYEDTRKLGRHPMLMDS